MKHTLRLDKFPITCPSMHVQYRVYLDGEFKGSLGQSKYGMYHASKAKGGAYKQYAVKNDAIQFLIEGED